MHRKFNYTGRKKILREHIRLSVEGGSGSETLKLGLDLEPYSLPPDGKIFLEASKRTLFKRFYWGTVAATIPPNDRSISDLGEPEGLTFRIKITGGGGSSGKLLATANNLKLRDEEDTPANRKPLLPVRSEDLDGPLWKVEFGEKETFLYVQSGLTKEDLIADAQFAATVYPAALKEILERIHWENYEDNDWDDEASDDWQARWLRFGSKELGCGPAPLDSNDDQGAGYFEWVERVVREFCRRHDFVRRFSKEWKGGGR